MLDLSVMSLATMSSPNLVRPKVLGRGIYCFFLNNSSEVHKKLLVRCPETIQHICTSILIFDKTITFAWLTKIMQILSVRPKVLGSGNHSKPNSLGSGNHVKLKRPYHT